VRGAPSSDRGPNVLFTRVTLLDYILSLGPTTTGGQPADVQSLNRLPLGRDHGLLLQPVRYGQGQLGCVTGPALTLQGSKRAYDHTRVALSRCQPRPYSGSAVLSRFELPFSQFSRLAVGDFARIVIADTAYAVPTPLRQLMPTTITT